jgi:lysophospholipase L1-like esterase
MRLAVLPGGCRAFRSATPHLIRRRAFLVTGITSAALLAAAVSPASASAGTGRYVSLGDSYAAGPLIPHRVGLPAACLRSSHSYPYLVAAAIGRPKFRDISCQGADTTNMTRPESVPLGTNPPQFRALTRKTSLVTLQIGGNNINFLNIVVNCTGLSFTDPLGSPCKSHYTSGGTDRLARAVARTAPRVARVLKGIRRRAPIALVLLVGYPVILPASGTGCWPLVPIAHGDVPYLRGIERKLNKMLAAEAARHGATYVNTYAASVGHDACQLPGTKWTEGLVPTSPAAPFHPNALGEKSMARRVIAAVRSAARSR